MKDYQKVLLYAYPKLERMAEDIGQIVLAKARASVMGRETALACAEKLIRYNFLRGQILFLKDSCAFLPHLLQHPFPVCTSGR